MNRRAKFTVSSATSMNRRAKFTVSTAVAIRGTPYAARRHAVVPRDLQLRVAQDDWERNDFHERVRA
jgi:hypothetical protein